MSPEHLVSAKRLPRQKVPSLVEPSWRRVEHPDNNPDRDSEAEDAPDPIRALWEALQPRRPASSNHEAKVEVWAKNQQDCLHANKRSDKDHPPAAEGGRPVEVPKVEAHENRWHGPMLGARVQHCVSPELFDGAPECVGVYRDSGAGRK